MNVLSKININGTTYQIGGSGSGGSSEPEIVKGYLSSGSFYDETQTAVTPSTDKLYIDTTTNKMYIYSGSAYVEVNNISVMGASGTNHAPGLVPDPGSTTGTSKYLREDGTWAEPAGGGASINKTIYETSNAGGAISIDANNGDLLIYTLTGNVSGITLSNMSNGQELCVIFYSSSARTITINHSSTYRCPGAEALTLDIPAGGYCEINFLATVSNNTATYYVRGV